MKPLAWTLENFACQNCVRRLAPALSLTAMLEQRWWDELNASDLVDQPVEDALWEKLDKR